MALTKWMPSGNLIYQTTPNCKVEAVLTYGATVLTLTEIYIIYITWNQHPTESRLYKYQERIPDICTILSERRMCFEGQCFWAKLKNKLLSYLKLWTTNYGTGLASPSRAIFIYQLCSDLEFHSHDLPTLMHGRNVCRNRSINIRACSTE